MRKLMCLLLAVCAVEASAQIATEKCGIVDQVCISGPEVRVIDGMDVFRECWAYQTNYACVQPQIHDTCDPVKAKGCLLTNRYCPQGVTIDGSFLCITEEDEYTCKKTDGKSTTTTDCSKQQFCIDGKCFDTGSVPDPDFNRAVTGMEAGREAGSYIDEDTFEVFKGIDSRCSKTVLQNCCKTPSSSTNGLRNSDLKDKGSSYMFDVLGVGSAKRDIWGFDPVALTLSITEMVVAEMMGCSKNEVIVAVRRDHKLCHYVGDYCSKKLKLLFATICLEHTETHCCYNSILARIINEAARGQIQGMDWGGPENPKCNGLTVGQFQSLNFDKIDFTEFYDQINPSPLDTNAATNNAQQKVNSYYQN